MSKFCCPVVALWCCYFTGARESGKSPTPKYCGTGHLGNQSKMMATATRTAKKAVGLDQQNKILHVRAHHLVLYISLPSLHKDDVNRFISHLVEDVNARQRFSNSFSKLRFGL